MFAESKLYQDDLLTVMSTNIPWYKLNRKSIFITGASGLLGTCLIDALMLWNKSQRGNGVKLYAGVRDVKLAEKRFAEYREDVCVLQWDVNKSLKKKMNVDYVIHAASNTHPLAYANDPIGTIMTNTNGLNNVLDYARKIKAERTIFISSVEIYGQAWSEDVFSEQYCGYIDCNTLRAGYPESKRVGESICQAYIEKYGMDIVIPRLSRTFGPNMRKNDSKALSQFIKNAVNNEDIVLKSNGNQKYSYLYVVDAVSAILFLLLCGEKGEAYNVGQMQKILTLRELAYIISNYVNVNIKFDIPEELEKKGFSPVTTAIVETDKLCGLGWKQNIDISTALKHTIDILKMDKSKI